MAVVRQPDQRRFQVFVSSTYLDLREERLAVTTTLLESDAFPAGMEIFPASDDDAWSLIKGVIDDSDYYLVVVGGKYGSVDPTDDIGFTEREYDYAVSIGKPVMAFLHGAPDSLTVEKSEKTEEMQGRLAAFLAKIQGAKHVKFWLSPEDLAGKVAVSLNKQVRQFPATGWVRADQVASLQTIADLNDARSKIRDLEAQLELVHLSPPPGTEDLAQGSDEFRLGFVARGSFVRPGALGQVRASALIDHYVTWDHLLGILAPSMLVDAEQSTLKNTLNASAPPGVQSAALDELRGDARRKDKSIDTSKTPLNYEFGMEEDDFGIVLLQLKALGLIEKSNRKTSVNDAGTYWQLTPFGEQRAIQTRAIRKPLAESIS